MLLLNHFEDRRRKQWCAVVVLVAVFSLIVSVATRYSSGDLSFTTVKAFQSHASPEAKRQRLANDADHWNAPAICLSILQSPRSYPRIASAGPSIPRPLFDESLYNRPPPSSESLL
jgi:hypothetical protein